VFVVVLVLLAASVSLSLFSDQGLLLKTAVKNGIMIVKLSAQASTCFQPNASAVTCIRISEILGEPQASLERLLRENIAPEGSKKTVEAIYAEKVQKAGNTYYDASSSVSGNLSNPFFCSLICS